MNKQKFFTTSLIAISAFLLGAGINNVAHSEAAKTVNPQGIKIGVVDVNQVVSSSQQVKALKAQQDAKKKELVKWLDTVKTDIQKQSRQENKVKLAQKYDKELIKKQEAAKNDYVKKLEAIDNSISKTITDTAKAKGYTIVFAKSSVLYGGDDLTQEIKKVVK